MSVIKIGTRKSMLALWQARHVADLLKNAHPGIEPKLIEITTEGDRFLDAPLAQAGGKGLFLKELEQALIANQIDLAVHSMKDVTVSLPEGLHIGAILKRDDVRDALVSNNNVLLAELPAGATVGTCSLRRQCLLRYHYPNLQVRNVRGNVISRLAKQSAGEFDALILAAVGLKRLNQAHRIVEYLSEEHFIPAVGQGAIGVECRLDDVRVNELLKTLNHKLSSDCVSVERAVNQGLGGGCHMPLAVYAKAVGKNLQIFAFAGLPDGNNIISQTHIAPISNLLLAGKQMTDKLINSGVMKVIDSINERTQ